MKLYYSPGACSLSPHIVLREAELPFELVKVDTRAKKLENGDDFLAITAKSYVPVLELDNGERLTEGAVIVQYLADQVPAKKLAPANGTFERYRLQEALNYVTAELHKNFGPLFFPDTPEDYKPVVRKRLLSRLEYADGQLAKKTYLFGDTFTVADAYLFTVANWSAFVNLDIKHLKNLTSYLGRVRERPAVQAALEAEGLTK
jgi:glutathione S-transferase